MKKSEVKVGMEVTLTEQHYGEHCGTPAGIEPRCHDIRHNFLVLPGMKGIVAAVDVPVVYHTPGNPMSFVCVDFIDPATGCRFRVRPWYSRIKKFAGA